MTAICGFCTNKKVYIGGDSAGSYDGDVHIREDQKVFINDEYLFGFTGSFRMGQVLRYCFVAPERSEGISDFKFLVSEFIPAIQQTLSESGVELQENGIKSGGTFLLGYRGSLYIIYDDYQVAKSIDNYAACGYGEAYAIGAMYAINDYDILPKQRIKIALEAATKYTGCVRPPYTILSI